MVIAAWLIVVALFVVGLAATFYPILPGVYAVFAAFFVYGFMVSFEPFGWWFWIIQSLILIVLTVADYAISAMGVKKFGGSKASVWGSTIGLIIGPFVIPAFGLILGPFIGAVIGEMLTGADFNKAVKAGIGSVLGFFASSVMKIILKLVMITVFLIWVL